MSDVVDGAQITLSDMIKNTLMGAKENEDQLADDDDKRARFTAGDTTVREADLLSEASRDAINAQISKAEVDAVFITLAINALIVAHDSEHDHED